MVNNMRKLAIMMRLKLDGEALNNEGNVGNVMQPRTIELSDGTIRNALAGEMLKHYHSRNVRLLANDYELCDKCKIFSPMKSGDIKNINKDLSASGNRVKECIVDDIEGFMNADGNKNEKRTSCIRFSWGIGIEENEYQTMLHTRVDQSKDGGKKKKKDDDSQPTQMLFHRPIRGDEYAITIQLELDRIGFDDEKLEYVFKDNEIIKQRQTKALLALKNMFLDMEGAMCSTRLPHIRNIEGIIVDKQDKNDILVKYSALNDDYIKVNKKLATNTKQFDNIFEFSKVIEDLITSL